MKMFSALKGSQGVWVRRVEHFVLRVVSLAFSLGSAHAIRWFFAPLDGVDVLQPFITWMIAIGFGVLGYFVSRGLAHRLMNKERIRAYAPICFVVELVEIFCNYALAAAVIQRARWLDATPTPQHLTLTVLTYVVLSIIPLVSVLLAVVDMDLERSKHGGMGYSAPASAVSGLRTPSFSPVSPSLSAAGMTNGASRTTQGQPKNAPYPTLAGSALTGMSPAPVYAPAPAMTGTKAGGAAPFAPVQVQTS